MEAHKDLTTRFINPAQKYFREKCAFPIEKGRLKATALIIPDWTAEAPNELGETFAGIHHEYINNSPIPPNLSDHTSELISPLVQSYFFGRRSPICNIQTIDSDGSMPDDKRYNKRRSYGNGE
jgi:hypothetical protein